jgi:hypothetical protein
MNVKLTATGNNARLLGMVAVADADVGNSTIAFYDSDQPAVAGAAAGVSPLVQVVLSKPCGVIVDDLLVFQPLHVGGDLIALDGNAKWGRWFACDGAALLDGDASNNSGSGFFKIEGTDDVALRAGGRAVLGEGGIA